MLSEDILNVGISVAVDCSIFAVTHPLLALIGPLCHPADRPAGSVGFPTPVKECTIAGSAPFRCNLRQACFLIPSKVATCIIISV